MEEGILDFDNIVEYPPIKVKDEHILRTHIMVPDLEKNLTPSHKVAVGVVIGLADALMKGEIKNGFGLIRPPGHHSVKFVYGNRGFCNINNEAILVDYLRAAYGIKKIAIIDTDCHHGDGTQDIFWHDPNVLCISVHQDGRTLYPGTGFIEDAGGPTAYGTTLNYPLPPNTGEKGFLDVLEKGILPILDEFQPEIIINSAGQDNHYTDPITNMNFSAQGYSRLTELLNPHLAVLEGGYSIEGALPYVNVGILLALAGIDYSFVREPDYSLDKVSQDAEHSKYIDAVISDVRKIWDNRNKNNGKQFCDESGFFSRTKRLNYDTDGISDLQLEKISKCTDCSGYILVDSKCRDRNLNVFAVIVPFGVCDGCQVKAKKKFENASTKYDFVYFQDQINNIFIRK